METPSGQSEREFSCKSGEKASVSNDDAEPILAWVSEDGYVSPADRASLQERDEVLLAELVEEPDVVLADRPRGPRRRRVFLPIALFAATCVSTFFAGACVWVPSVYVELSARSGSLMPLRRVLVSHWQDGLIYMACVLAILLMHEMGHFLATIRYGVPSSLPFFLPMPVISPTGTLGAVIGMEGFRANRREIFDIGLAGPLAGLLVAMPILWLGVVSLDFTHPGHGIYQLDNPLLVRFLLDCVQPAGYVPGQRVVQGQLNPYFMAGWVGLLVTGLNMMPVSQLDGGHVLYTLLGKRAHWVARGCIVLAVAYSFYAWQPAFALMIVLIMIVGPDHPPTRDDSIPLGWFRTVVGSVCAIAIPLLCFAPRLLIILP
jgi:Zn-dependent protease